MATAQVRAAERPRPGPLRLQAVLWNALGPGSIAYALTELLDNLPEGAVERKLWCLSADPASPHEYDSPALPKIAFRALCKAGVSATVQGRIASAVALRSIKAGDVVYMWPPYDLRMIKRVQDLGAFVVAERTNCMAQMGRAVLSKAYARRGLPLPESLC